LAHIGMPSGEAANYKYNFIDPKIYRTGGEHVNHYTTDAVSHTLQTQKQKIQFSLFSFFNMLMLINKAFAYFRL